MVGRSLTCQTMTTQNPDPVMNVRELEIPGGFMTTRKAAQFLGTSTGYLYSKLYKEYGRIVPYATLAGRLFWSVNDLKDYKRTHDRLGEVSQNPELQRASSARATTSKARRRAAAQVDEVVA